jgi:hypothetical protein
MVFSARALRARSVLGGRAKRGRSRSRAEGATGAERRREQTAPKERAENAIPARDPLPYSGLSRGATTGTGR